MNISSLVAGEEKEFRVPGRIRGIRRLGAVPQGGGGGRGRLSSRPLGGMRPRYGSARRPLAGFRFEMAKYNLFKGYFIHSYLLFYCFTLSRL